MKIAHVCLTPFLLCLTLSLTACKKGAEASQELAVGTSAATIPVPAVAAGVPAAAAPAAPASAEFDFSSVAESAVALPPFPYIDYPPTLKSAFQETQSSPMDEPYVILGKNLYRVEGRVQTRTFHNDHAEMSELEIRRNYEGAIKALGGIKVNDVQPDDKTLIAANGDEFVMRKQKLRIPEVNLSYDAYLIRKGSVRHWIVLMVNGRTTRLLSIEETPFVQTVGYMDDGGRTKPVTAIGAPPAATEPVDVDALAVTETALPPFPYLAYPPTVKGAFQETKTAKFDAASVIVGKQLRTLEGRVETRSFNNMHANMSSMALRRNYEAAVKGLGGIKVNSAQPEDAVLITANGDETTMRDKLRILERNMSYDSYLIRTPQKRVWIVLMFSDSKTRILAVEEKDFVQSVAFVTADKMRTELAANGRIALYVNFDTDQATIRPDGKPAVDEISTLMKKDPTLKLAIEGHTDNVGDAKHNKELSQRRADAVVASLVAAGIEKARLSSSGIGDARPLADNKDEPGRAKNRRVELVKK